MKWGYVVAAIAVWTLFLLWRADSLETQLAATRQELGQAASKLKEMETANADLRADIGLRGAIAVEYKEWSDGFAATIREAGALLERDVEYVPWGAVRYPDSVYAAARLLEQEQFAADRHEDGVCVSPGSLSSAHAGAEH